MLYLSFNPKQHTSFELFSLDHAKDILTVDAEGETCIKCIICSGSGWIYDPEERSDAYEGNKLRSQIKCPNCMGAKMFELTEGNLAPYKSQYNIAMRKHQEEETKRELEKDLRRRVDYVIMHNFSENECKHITVSVSL